MADNIYGFPVRTIDGRDTTLAAWQGKVLLVVNVASQCGFTPQYAGLEALWQCYRDQGLVVLGFPCNQFGAQEPGDAAAIAGFCSATYGVSFPLFAKIEVNGEGAHPLYRYLKDQVPGLLGSEAIKWNFTKFLVDRRGQPVERFAPTTTPEKLQPAVERCLQAAT